jgi:sulfite exporter TauE/SafE
LQIDLYVAAAGLLVGFTVGLTGMGGGALMTPLLVLLFKVQPLAAVSSDLVAAVIMKPVGGGVHLRRGTVNLGLVRWLMVGSVPAAFSGVLVLRQLGDGAVVQARVRNARSVTVDGRIGCHDPPQSSGGLPGRYGHRLLPICCPTAPTRPSDHNLNRLSASSKLHEPEGW